MPARFQEAHDEPPANRIVIGDQDSQSSGFDHPRVRRRLPGIFRGTFQKLEACREVKAASRGDLAVHPDPAVEQPDQAVADCQAETRASETSCDGAIRLLECLENGGLLLFGNTDTRVRHHEMKLHRTGGALASGQREGNAAPLGEFNGVSRKIDENLAQTGGVADQPVRHRFANVTRDVQSFSRSLWLDNANRGAQAIGNGKGNGIEFDVSSLDPGEIQDVINDLQQRFGATPNGFEIVPLLRIQGCLEREVGVAHDSVDGRTNFMAHVGQEIALGKVGLLGRSLQGRFLPQLLVDGSGLSVDSLAKQCQPRRTDQDYGGHAASESMAFSRVNHGAGRRTLTSSAPFR